jgi:hypothetical protein
MEQPLFRVGSHICLYCLSKMVFTTFGCFEVFWDFDDIFSSESGRQIATGADAFSESKIYLVII